MMNEYKLTLRRESDGKMVCPLGDTELRDLIGKACTLAIGKFGELCLYDPLQWKKVVQTISSMHMDDTRILRPFMSSASPAKWEGDGFVLPPKHASYANIVDSVYVKKGQDEVWRFRGKAEE